MNIRRFVLVLGLLLCALPASAAIVEINSGRIEGLSLGKVDRFMGVPYAAPPVGGLRWRAPQPPLPWRGVRPAFKAGSACVQIGNFFASADATTFDKPYGAEDCLYLNVWAPKRADKARPVLVFIHGGSGIAGDAAHPLYDGARLAEELDAVVITANYRLGVFGSLQSPALQNGNLAEDSGSFYLLDVIRVLDWTRENCPAFGCDGENITISGQSAGAVIVLGLLRSPLAEGKFQKAISLSGVPFSGSIEKAYARTQKLLTALLLNDGSVAEEKEAAQLLQNKSPDALREYLYKQPVEALIKASGRGLPHVAVDDGVVLKKLDKPEKPAPVVVSRVPLLMGKARNEMTTLMPLIGPDTKISDLWPYYSGSSPEQAGKKGAGWFRRVTHSAKVGLVDLYLRRKFRSFVDQYASQLPSVYVYSFEWDNYPEPWRTELGAFHGLDIPFVFGNFIDDREIYMRFAWAEDNRADREALHHHIALSLRAFMRLEDTSAQQSLNGAWMPWQDGGYIRKWDGDVVR